MVATAESQSGADDVVRRLMICSDAPPSTRKSLIAVFVSSRTARWVDLTRPKAERADDASG